VTVDLGTLIVAGFTGRDEAAVRRHIDELAASGISAPASVPELYIVPVDLLTTASEIEVDGDETSGEVEPVAFVTTQGTFIGVGSDHTDRERERDSIASAKRACPKVFSKDVVRLDAVAKGLDDLVLRSTIDGHTLYQRASLRELLPLPEIIERARQHVRDGEDFAVFCGTVPLADSLKYADAFSGQLLGADGEVLSSYSYGVRRRSRK
jgi:4-hydroxyphenylacetate 3-monooxygenase